MKGAVTTPFESNIGSPQGGSISGPLFEIYFENALKDVRDDIKTFKASANIEEIDTALPDEIIYADDCDFITEEDRIKKHINQNTDRTLLQHNLLVNNDKTERRHSVTEYQ